jgi:hypothetical protein
MNNGYVCGMSGEYQGIDHRPDIWLCPNMWDSPKHLKQKNTCSFTNIVGQLSVKPLDFGVHMGTLVS